MRVQLRNWLKLNCNKLNLGLRTNESIRMIELPNKPGIPLDKLKWSLLNAN